MESKLNMIIEKLDKIEKLLAYRSQNRKPINGGQNHGKDIYMFGKYYIDNYYHGISKTASQDQINAILNANAKRIKSILGQCADLDTAKSVLDYGAKYYSDKGLDWSLRAIDVNCPDFLNYVIKEKIGGKQ